MSSTHDSSVAGQLRENLDRVQTRIMAACSRSQRDPASVRLIAATKYTPMEVVQQLVKLGHRDFGENRPQQLIARAKSLEQSGIPLQRPENDSTIPPQSSPLNLQPCSVSFHLIGQLQRNKVRAVLPNCLFIHSVDSLRLLSHIDRIADELSLRPRVLLEVNISGEKTKSGFTAQELRRSWDDVTKFQNVRIDGLMTMAPYTEDLGVIRNTFRGLRELRDELQTENKQLNLNELSMGMSHDFEMAIEEGATMIRLGSVLFEGCGSTHEH